MYDGKSISVRGVRVIGSRQYFKIIRFCAGVLSKLAAISGSVEFAVFKRNEVRVVNNSFAFSGRGDRARERANERAWSGQKIGKSREGVWWKEILLIFSHSLAVSFPLGANGRLPCRLRETMRQNKEFSVQILSIEIQPYTSCFKD